MIPSPSCEIHLLGPVEIRAEDETIKISRRLERAILYYLAAEHRPISRTTLIDLLWPSTDDIDQRRALRTALSRLRNELPDSEIIQTELDQVWLDLDRCKVDLVIFEDLYQSLQSVLKAYQVDQTLPEQIVRQIQEALALWHGDKIITGDNLSFYPEIDAWRHILDRRLGNQRKSLMNRLAHHYQAAGHPQMALDLFIQLGKMDVLDVPIHLAVLNIFAKLGRHQEALDYCDALEVAFEDEYNLPLPEPIIKHCQSSQMQLNLNDQQRAKDWWLPLSMQLSLIGRQSELAQLKQAYYQGGLVLLQGKMGRGKTRLAQELYQTLIPKPTLLLAPVREMESSLPLSPIVHCLRRHIPENIWQDINKVWANQLSLILPELLEIREDCDPSRTSNIPSGKQHLFDAIHHVLCRVAEQSGNILFFLDNAQWADPHTLQALAYLYLQGFFDEHGLLIIAARPEEPNRYLSEMIDRFQRNYTVKEINLTNLTPYELGLLGRQVLDKQPSTAFIDKLYQETNGNPFVVLEILRNILDKPEELETFEHGKKLPLPESVHALIRTRLNRLDQESRDILEYAAVLGNEFSLESLQSVVGVDHLPFDEIIDPLINAGFIQLTSEDHSQPENLQFIHDKMREVVLRETSPLHLKILHQDVAKYLAAKPQADANAAVIARHYLVSGDTHNAYHWLLKAGEHAWALGDKEEALQAYQGAENLYKNAPEGVFDHEDLLELYYQWSEFAYQSNQVKLLEETAIKLQYLGAQEDNPLFTGVSHMALAKACFLRFELDDSLEYIEKAVDEIESTDNQTLLMQAILNQAIFHWWKLNFTDALNAAHRVLKISQSMGAETPDLISKKFLAKHLIGSVYLSQGNAKKALVNARELYKKDFPKLNPFERVRNLVYLGNAHFLSANYEESEHYHQKALEIAKLMDNSFVQELILIRLGKVHSVLGQLDQAYEQATTALKLGERNEHVKTIVSANTILGDIYVVLQNYTLASHHYRVAQIRAGFACDSFYEFENNIRLAHLLCWTEQLLEAKEIIEKTLEATERLGMNKLYAQSLIVSGICDLVEGNFPEAERGLAKAAEVATKYDLKFELVWSKIGQVRLAFSRHDFDGSEKLLKGALDESQSHNMTWLNLLSLELCAQLHKAKDQPTELVEYQKAFRELLKKLDENILSAPLRGDFENAKRSWEEGHLYP